MTSVSTYRPVQAMPHRLRIPSVYFLVDASRSFDIQFQLEGMACDYQCLIQGMEGSGHAGQLPYLVSLEKNSAAAEWVFGKAFGKDFGITIASIETKSEIIRGMKKFIRCDYLNFQNVFFRFFRPSVFHSFISAVEPRKQKEFLGNRVAYAENRSGTLVRKYAIADGRLDIRSMTVDAAREDMFSLAREG